MKTIDPAKLRAQVLQQRDDLGFHRRIQRRGRLVGEQQVRLDQQRHGDQHALAHAAGELMRIGRKSQRRIGDADALQRGDRARLGCLARQTRMAPAQHVDEMRADREQRIERRHRILKDHGDARAAPGVHRRLGKREQIGAVEHDLAVDAREVGRQQADEAGREARLARPRFADHADDAAAPDVEVDAAQDAGGAARGRRFERQLADRHQRRH